MTQKDALEILKMGKNVFLTGPAGSGKTHVLREYIDYLHTKSVPVAITASTGIAATHLDGQTIHSWSGLGMKESLSDYDLEDLIQKQYIYKRFATTKVLIIDEVSMLHAHRLDMIHILAQAMKQSAKPFGGLQVILCGDFFQLPPISRGMSEDGGAHFAYNARSFIDGNFFVCYLEEQYRQKDKEHLKLLNTIRAGEVDRQTTELLDSRLHKDIEVDGEPTKLFTHNVDVDDMNNRQLTLISGKSYSYIMTSTGNDFLVEALKKSCLSPATLLLKVGAKVMFTKNHPEGLYVNGTLGYVCDISAFGDPVVETLDRRRIQTAKEVWKIEEDGVVKAQVSQLPLRLAWAITVHKSQGMSLDALEVDLSKSFVPGMGYVALSRVRTLSGMKLLGYNQKALEVEREVLEKDFEFKEDSDKRTAWLHGLSKKEIQDMQHAFLEKSAQKKKKGKK
jgi:ATP-dependent exoDNAse (exonuclease V) alpha subunit